MMQTQLASILAIQSMQDYLKLLILTTNIDAKKSFTFQVQAGTLFQLQATSLTYNAPILSSPANETVVQKLEINTEHVPEVQSDSSTEVNCSDSSINYKKSHRLWNLLVKKHSTKTIKRADNVKSLNEDNEQSETDSNFNGVYIPVLKNKNSRGRKRNICNHPDREHNARGLCCSCYRLAGREKRPWNCGHERLYALGFCHKCYLIHNLKVRAQKQKGEIQSPNKTNAENAYCTDTFVKQE